MLTKFSKALAVTGHYGSGKTNLSINLALALKAEDRKVVLADLDVVNPYFVTADFKELAASAGIDLIAPAFAGTSLDSPSLTGELGGQLGSGATVMIDAGGDAEGCYALGSYAPRIREAPYDMLFVVNFFRYLTGTPEQAAEYMKEIETASRLKVSGIVNNSNLSYQTGVEDVLQSIQKAEQLARLTGRPLLFTSVERGLAGKLGETGQAILPIDVYVKTPW
ncbi:MAG: ParA family protein [Oscillospiraceae bacterium]|nr:ParA family protein [Oscillospiraceae bacterium]